MARIEKEKVYKGSDLDKVFITPMLAKPSVTDLGIHVMHNVPSPIALHNWSRNGGQVLKQYTASGWSGSSASHREQRILTLSKVKAEVGFSADDYFGMVIDHLKGDPSNALDDLSGTALEEAETAMFRDSIAEGIRSTFWFGNTLRSNGLLSSFNGIIPQLLKDAVDEISQFVTDTYASTVTENNIAEILKTVWDRSSRDLRSSKSEGQLAFFVTPDIWHAYEDYLIGISGENLYNVTQTGQEGLNYRGIPLVEVFVKEHIEQEMADVPKSFILLADRRNLVLAVNTNEMPGTEIKMWYNPDLMENRQRAIFAAGATYILPEYISFFYNV